MQLAEVSQPPSLPLPGSGEPAVALDGASFAWTAASEGGQPTVQDVSLEVCSSSPECCLCPLKGQTFRTREKLPC